MFFTLVTSTELSGAEDPIFLYPVVLNWSVKGSMKEGAWRKVAVATCSLLLLYARCLHPLGIVQPLRNLNRRASPSGFEVKGAIMQLTKRRALGNTVLTCFRNSALKRCGFSV